jgi:hypothetical protein
MIIGKSDSDGQNHSPLAIMPRQAARSPYPNLSLRLDICPWRYPVAFRNRRSLLLLVPYHRGEVDGGRARPETSIEAGPPCATCSRARPPEGFRRQARNSCGEIITGEELPMSNAAKLDIGATASMPQCHVTPATGCAATCDCKGRAVIGAH